MYEGGFPASECKNANSHKICIFLILLQNYRTLVHFPKIYPLFKVYSLLNNSPPLSHFHKRLQTTCKSFHQRIRTTSLYINKDTSLQNVTSSSKFHQITIFYMCKKEVLFELPSTEYKVI